MSEQKRKEYFKKLKSELKEEVINAHELAVVYISDGNNTNTYNYSSTNTNNIRASTAIEGICNISG
jgi:hypothetical protein